MNTTDFFSVAAAICPDRDFMVFEGTRTTYMEAGARINSLAFKLAEMGIEKGDRVGILSVNCPQYIESYFAAAKTGAIFVPLNFRAKKDELEYMLTASEARYLLVGERYLESAKEMIPSLPLLEKCISIDTPFENMLFYEDLVDAEFEDEYFSEVEDEDVTILMFTSGTTGRPKAVPLTHESFGSYILENVSPADPETEEKNILTVPLYHVAGVQGMLAGVYGGRTLVLMRQFEVEKWLQLVEEEKANRAMLVPTMLKQVIDHENFDKYDLSSLEVITYGAAAMPFPVIKKAIEMMPGVSFINAFGQTETGSTITMLGPEDHQIDGTEEEKEKKLRRLATSIGKPLPDVEIQIVDPDDNPLAPHQIGEIVARGPRVMRGYWKDEAKTKVAFTRDGWLKTSDQGWMDEEGYIYRTGRADDVIIRGGENISPKEVEEALITHPKIAEVAVIGVPDEEWGQQPYAVIVLKEGESATEEEIIDFTRDKLASFKCPRKVVFKDELPRTAIGKLQRKKLVEQYSVS
ncbi:MAG: long-chain fatty acid--CoA ligase [Desulfobacterales bacterium]